MARHYSTKSFFRQMPSTLLARYFEKKELANNFPPSDIENASPEQIFSKWINLPETFRKGIDAEFKEIFELSCEKGFRAILDEATWQMRNHQEALKEFIVAMSSLPNHYHRAMITFLNYPEYWRGASFFYHTDNLPFWRKRKNMGNLPANVDANSATELAKKIGDYFHFNEGRGKNCVVEVLRRGDLDYFLIYPEDYSQESIEYVDGKFGRRPHNPAFEIVFIYSQKAGTLDLNFKGSYKAVDPLRSIFAETILNLDELPPDPKDERIFNLNPILCREFNFVYDCFSGIKSVVVRKIRLSSYIKKGVRYTLEVDPSNDDKAIYDELEELSKVMPLHLYKATQVELISEVALHHDKPAKTERILITFPNSCSLKYDEIGLRLRSMLEASGIELSEPTGDCENEINKTTIVEYV